MANESLVCDRGLFGLFIAMLTGALWDSPLVMAPFRYFQSEGQARDAPVTV